MMADRLTYSIENKGTVIPIQNVVPTGFAKLEGRTGFGVAPTSLIMTQGAIEGSKWRRTRRGARSIDLPLGVFGANRQDVEDKLRLLIRTLGDRKTPAKLVATYPDGKRVSTSVHYSGGLDPQYGPGADTEGQEFCRIVLTLVAPSPYWVAETPISYALAAANQGRGLLPELEKLQLSSSQTIGTFTVENPGDVPSFPVWTIRGPGDDFSATLDGLTIAYDDEIVLGETVTINTVTKKVTSSIHGDAYTKLAPAPKMFPVPSGTSEIEIVMPNSTSDSLVTMYFNPRRELVY